MKYKTIRDPDCKWCNLTNLEKMSVSFGRSAAVATQLKKFQNCLIIPPINEYPCTCQEVPVMLFMPSKVRRAKNTKYAYGASYGIHIPFSVGVRQEIDGEFLSG